MSFFSTPVDTTMAAFSKPDEERQLVVVTEGRYQGTLGYEVDPEDEALFGHAYIERIPDGTILEVGPWQIQIVSPGKIGLAS